MWNMLWPVLIVVFSNVLYNICQKMTPESVNPFGTLMVTYLASAVITALLFALTSGISALPAELRKANWTSFLLSASIVGLETGFIFLYRAGWKVSTGPLVCNIALAVVLVFVGMFLYKETVSLRQVLGMLLCSAGLVLITG